MASTQEVIDFIKRQKKAGKKINDITKLKNVMYYYRTDPKVTEYLNNLKREENRAMQPAQFYKKAELLGMDKMKVKDLMKKKYPGVDLSQWFGKEYAKR